MEVRWVLRVESEFRKVFRVQMNDGCWLVQGGYDTEVQSYGLVLNGSNAGRAYDLPNGLDLRISKPSSGFLSPAKKLKEKGREKRKAWKF